MSSPCPLCGQPVHPGEDTYRTLVGPAHEGGCPTAPVVEAARRFTFDASPSTRTLWAHLCDAVDRLTDAQRRSAVGLPALAIEAVQASRTATRAGRARPDGRRAGQTARANRTATDARRRLIDAVRDHQGATA